MTHSCVFCVDQSGTRHSIRTDFAAKTDLFTSFASKVARMAYAAVDHAAEGVVAWPAIVNLFPELEVERKAVEAELREKVTVLPAAVQRLPA